MAKDVIPSTHAMKPPQSPQGLGGLPDGEHAEFWGEWLRSDRAWKCGALSPLPCPMHLFQRLLLGYSLL